jgi:hypothetical protein
MVNHTMLKTQTYILYIITNTNFVGFLKFHTFVLSRQNPNIRHVINHTQNHQRQCLKHAAC